jgi:hypothetical protein
MKPHIILLFFALSSAIASAMPFSPLPPGETYFGTSNWRFASSLTSDDTGRIEICYAEDGSPVQILGSVAIYPFRSSEAKMPDLRILFAKATVQSAKKVILIVSYGIRSGVFVVDVPGLTSHSLVSSGTPHPDQNGEITLLGFGHGGVTIKPDGIVSGIQGRLFIRYIGSS